jgi:glycosyltransferase involved in cell wall biosynthesis
MTYLPRWHLTIVGDGPDRARLKRLVIRRHLTGRVAFTGWLPRATVQERIIAADVLLFPSLHEEGGWACAEAIAAGIPVVSLDRGGPPELGARGVRISTPEATARAIAAASLEEVSSPRRNADDTWTLDRRRDALLKLLRQRGLLPRDD